MNRRSKSLEKPQCLWTLLSGWAFCCKHGSLQVMDKLTICFRMTLPVQHFSKCGPSPPGAASPKKLMKNPNFHPQSQPSASEIPVMGSGNLYVVSRHPAYPVAHLSLGTTVPVPAWEMQWVIQIEAQEIFANSSALKRKKKKSRGMSVGRAGCMREDFVKPYTWQEISRGHLEHQLSNFIGSQHFLGGFQKLYLLGPTPDSSNRIGILFRDPLSLLLLHLLGIL